jgi:hypothetical protein
MKNTVDGRIARRKSSGLGVARALCLGIIAIPYPRAQRSQASSKAPSGEKLFAVAKSKGSGSSRAAYGAMKSSAVVKAYGRALLFLGLGALGSWGMVFGIAHGLSPFYEKGLRENLASDVSQPHASIVFPVDDETCTSCGKMLATTTQDLVGVHTMKLLRNPERVAVTYDPTDITPQGIADALERLGLHTGAREQPGTSTKTERKESTDNIDSPLQLHSRGSNQSGHSERMTRRAIRGLESAV